MCDIDESACETAATRLSQQVLPLAAAERRREQGVLPLRAEPPQETKQEERTLI
jgi:hypothetical protein